MDQTRFDDLTRGLASGVTRRRLLGNFTRAALGGVLLAAAASEADARKQKGHGGKRKRQPTKSAGCTLWVLAGEADPNGPHAHIRVDDDLTVSVNGQVVAKDDDGLFSEVGPYIFTARAGDQLRIVATDVGAGWHELGALFLRCASGGIERKLSDGFPRTESFPEPAGTFFDETFTI